MQLRPGVNEMFPDPLAGLYAFSIATADLGLPHQLMASLMVSDTSVSEGPNNDGGGTDSWWTGYQEGRCAPLPCEVRAPDGVRPLVGRQASRPTVDHSGSSGKLSRMYPS